MTTTTMQKMSVKKYQALVRRIEKRFGPEKSWDELPLRHQSGGPMRGSGSLLVTRRMVTLPRSVWACLAAAAERHGVTAHEVVAGLALQAADPHQIDRTIAQMIRRGFVKPS